MRVDGANILTVSGSINSNIAFQIENGTNGNLVTILNSGRMGIGIVNPGVELDVLGNINMDYGSALMWGTSSNSQLYFANANNFYQSVGGQTQFRMTDTAAWYDNIDKFYIASGNVGIGNTIPNATLDVDGDSIFRADMNITAGEVRMAPNNKTCYGWSCEGSIYYNGSSLVIKVT